MLGVRLLRHRPVCGPTVGWRQRSQGLARFRGAAEPTNADAPERAPPVSVIGKTGVYGFRALRYAEPRNDRRCSPAAGRGGSGAAHVDLPLRRPDGRVLHHQPVRRRQRKPRPGAEALPFALAGQAHGPGPPALRLDAQRPAPRLVPEEALAGDLHAVHAVLVAACGDAVGAPEALIGLRRRFRPRLRLRRQSEGDGNSDKNQRASWHREEIARYGLMWVVFVGGAVVTRKNTHIAVELLSNVMRPGPARSALLALIDFVKLGFLGLLAYFSVTIVERMHYQRMTVFERPMSLVYGGVAFGCFLMFARQIHNVWKNARQGWTKPHDVVDQATAD